MKNQNNQDKITGHYIIYAQLRLESPLQIASGSSDNSDKDMMLFYKDTESEGSPYIPAAAITGALFHYYKKMTGRTKDDDDEKFTDIEKYFWGDKDKDGKVQSHFMPEDVMCFDENYKITRRDGVKIDTDKGTAIRGGKYDYEILDPGLTFHFKAEIKLRNNIEETSLTEIENQIAAIKYCFSSKDFRIGANTNNGFGKLKLICFKVWRWDYTNDKDAAHQYIQYLNQLHKAEQRNLYYYQCFPPQREIFIREYIPHFIQKLFTIKATFAINSSLIIGAPGSPSDETDKPHLQSNGKNIISGKSLRGAIRHRAEIIRDFIHMSDVEFLEIFGSAGEKEKNGKPKRAQKARLKIEETTIEKGKANMHTRIKIDRFTGGTVDTALFDTKPIWKEDAKNEGDFTIQFTLPKAVAKEKILLMHLLKDLWTGDLQVGGEKNIGRGVLKGIKAMITDGDNQFNYPVNKKMVADYFNNIQNTIS